jgi:4-amino-4-deoxy-L-arabinose transferase-like glycosyltransferase
VSSSSVVAFGILFAGLTIVRFLFIGTTMVVDDEAYYLMYARHLDWGYLDHGPVIGFLIRGSTALFGETGFAIRFFGPMMLTILGVVLFMFGRRCYSTTTGVALSLTATVNMLTHTNGVVVTPDAPMVFFLILAISAYHLAFFEDGRYFAPAGLLLGLAVLSKISAVFPALGIALFPVFSREHRRSLKDGRYYLSFVVAVATVVPFLIWNVSNDFAFFRYQGSHVARAGGIKSFLELWSGLFALTGPVLFYHAVVVPLGMAVPRRLGKIGPRRLFFALTAVAPLVYFLVHSLFSHFELNWPAPALCGGIFLFGLAVGESWERMRRRWRFQIGYSLVLIAVVTLQVYFPILPLRGKYDPTNRYYEYTALREDLGEVLAQHPDVQGLRIVANNYQIPSMINLYHRPPLEAICLSVGYHETLYAFHYPDESLVGEDFVVVAQGGSFPGPLRTCFASYSKLGEIESTRRGKTVRTFGVWRAADYSGKGPRYSGGTEQ